jgi:hypothetical protein
MSLIAHRVAGLLTLCAGLAVAVFAVFGSAAFLLHLGFSSQSWITSAALVALAGTAFAVIYYYLNLELSKKIADRTVILEAQKLLLEINKALLTDPRLFSIYDEGDELRVLIAKYTPGENSNLSIGGLAISDLLGKLVAFGCMLINVFEIVFAQLPKGAEHVTWQEYFEDSLNRCSVIRDLLELKEADKIYHQNLMTAFRSWKQKIDEQAAIAATAERVKVSEPRPTSP